MTTPELRRAFHDELSAVHSELVSVGRAVCQSVGRATRALLEHDLEAADYGIAFDDEVDARTMDVEDQCLHVMALQAPVAGDLRQIATALRISGEVERSADLVANLCKAVHRLPGPLANHAMAESIRAMSDLASRLLLMAVESYADGDELAAISVAELDAELDEVQRTAMAQIFDQHQHDALELPSAVQLAMVARFYERIGDHAVNISERVRFMVTGFRPLHEGAERFRNRPAAERGGQDVGQEAHP